MTKESDWFEASFYVRLPSGPLTQGDIWRNLPLSHWQPSHCSGLVITPRCDLAHDNSPVINYLPIVSDVRLLQIHGGFALLEQELDRALVRLKHLANVLNRAELIDVVFSPQRILEILESELAADALPAASKRHREKNLQEFRDTVQRIVDIEHHLNLSSIERNDLQQLVSEKDVKKYMKEVMLNKIADLHFLPPCLHLLERPSVVLLRHVTTCSIDFLKAALDCISTAGWERISTQRFVSERSLVEAKPERILRLKSPYFEALLARFAALFGRIGVRDIDEATIERFLKSE